jgi:transposase
MLQIGIIVKTNEESYTSKCDALALEEIKNHDEYLGKRIKRGLFSSSKNKLINADLNGAINIMRKYYKKNEIEIKEITGIGLCNPKTIKIPCEV